jgi:hypothetical protein
MKPPTIKLSDVPDKTLKQLFRRANSDSDAATIAWLGDHEETAQGAIIIIRGNIAARFVAEHLEKWELTTRTWLVS